MPESRPVIELPTSEPERLAAAVEAAVRAHARTIPWMQEGAQQSARAEWTAEASAHRFQTMLEIGYLVASADGFVPEERASLASLLEKVTEKAIDHEALDLHFRDLDDAVASLGRRERLARTAADLDDEATVEHVISLVAMIAMADGVLSTDEHAVLIELGRYAKLSPERVDALVEAAATHIKEGLR